MTGKSNDRTIRDWMGIFAELYSQPDSARTPEQIWITVMAHSSSIGESIRRVAFQDLLKYASHTFCWLCSFVSRCNQLKDDIFSFEEPLCGMVSIKYPLVCGHCTEARCRCDPEKTDAIEDKSAQYEDLLDRRAKMKTDDEAYTIADWKDILWKIYGGRIHIQTLESIGFHYLEEVGEAAFAVRKLSELKGICGKESEGIDVTFLNGLTTVERIVKSYKEYYRSDLKDRPDFVYTSKEPDILKWRIVDGKMRMVIEIADTFSWFCAIMNKLDSISKASKFPLLLLEDQLRGEYFDDHGNPRCPTCQAKPCKCVFFF